jgi:hypothetical protein
MSLAILHPGFKLRKDGISFVNRHSPIAICQLRKESGSGLCVIYLRFAMRITEPVTMLTDYVLALAGIAFAIGLVWFGPPARSTTLWIIAFAAGAVAAAVGGTFHGFASYMEESTRRRLWNITVLSIGASAAFMISAALTGPLDRHLETTRWLKAGLGLSIAGLLIQATGFRHGKDYNHNDLFHVVQTVALYFFYRGARG